MKTYRVALICATPGGPDTFRCRVRARSVDEAEAKGRALVAAEWGAQARVTGVGVAH